ncbi:DJ-1/PfpI family protein [Pseudonocardia alni]|uniref:DJ-1/PfpI family protein n=1 Tax=Pseudonocardia alni TaxID=33907 RepID=A0AA44UND0_PSEA5|nr:DJ-1/PfpI family protein [Pseudonocardia alni]
MSSLLAGPVGAVDHAPTISTVKPIWKVTRPERPSNPTSIGSPCSTRPTGPGTDPAAVEFVRAFVGTGKPVASICHGPWTLAEADVIRGRRLTSWASIRTDLRDAGAEVVDDEVCVDGQFITSRSPFDLPAFCAAIVEQFAAVPAAA